MDICAVTDFLEWVATVPSRKTPDPAVLVGQYRGTPACACSYVVYKAGPTKLGLGVVELQLSEDGGRFRWGSYLQWAITSLPTHQFFGSANSVMALVTGRDNSSYGLLRRQRAAPISVEALASI
jgi:hypothetical protein